MGWLGFKEFNGGLMTKPIYKAGDEVTPPRANGRPRKYDEPTMRLRIPVRLESEIIAYIKKLLTNPR